MMSQKRFLFAVALTSLLSTALFCSSVFAVDPIAAPFLLPEDYEFVHPGLLHTDTDFQRMYAKVMAGESPWIEGYQALTSSGRAQLSSQNSPRPLENVTAPGYTVRQMYIDIARAYQLALIWKISNDTVYADQAVQYLDAWSSTLKRITGDTDSSLTAGIHGHQWANVAEIMRTYEGWPQQNFTRFQNMLLNIFYPMNHDFLVRHNSAKVSNYWVNWDLCNMAAMIAIGTLCDRVDIFNEAVEYGLTGEGGLTQMVYYVHAGNLGQWEESGRDQGHSTLGIALAGPFLQIAWNQGIDLFSIYNNIFLAGAEYVSKTNVYGFNQSLYDMPWTDFSKYNAYSTGLSPAARPHIRPCWELIYHHYVNRLGLAAPWVENMLQYVRPESDGFNGDQLGFGTLTFALDPPSINSSLGLKPKFLTVEEFNQTAVLSWWGSTHAQAYTVYRSIKSGKNYIRIAFNLSNTDLTYTDMPTVPGVYYYVVTALTTDGRESDYSNEVRVVTGSELILYYNFDEVNGSVVHDSSGSVLHGTVMNGTSFVRGVYGNALNFDGSNTAYVQLPNNIVSTLADFTVSVFVKVTVRKTWARIFDFGQGTQRYMFLTAASGSSNQVQYSINTVYTYNTRTVLSNSVLPLNQWTHVAVVQSGSNGTIYVNGSVVGVSYTMDFSPFRLLNTTLNYLGKSQFPDANFPTYNDPYFNGLMDEFRIYRGALTAEQIQAIASSQTPIFPTLNQNLAASVYSPAQQSAEQTTTAAAAATATSTQEKYQQQLMSSSMSATNTSLVVDSADTTTSTTTTSATAAAALTTSGSNQNITVVASSVTSHAHKQRYYNTVAAMLWLCMTATALVSY